MLKQVLAIVGFAYAVMAQSGYPQADEVTTLWQQPNVAQKFGMYSGYISIPHTKKELHYLATLSQKNPATDPVIVWLNGGPGCSSLLGYALEHGPYLFEDGNMNLTENAYAWNKEANVIYLDAPAGTGFSICGDQNECLFDDNNQADDNLEAII
jgi:cathepsin A (carboxypeptidase C)